MSFMSGLMGQFGKNHLHARHNQPFHPIPPNFSSPLSMRELGLYEFSFDWKLGSGLTSDAYMGRHRTTGEMVCVKVVDLHVFKDERQRKMFQNQIQCQKRVKSPHIINILDVYDTESFCFIVTELCEDGDLFKLIQFSKIGLPEPLVTRLAYSIALALSHLKLCQIVHRDIKSENIMLTKGIAKLGDFGFALPLQELGEKEAFNVGSPLYMPLEALQSNKYGYQSDIFSFGVVLYEMLHGQSPWECHEEKQLIQKIKNQPVEFKGTISEGMKGLILGCLEKERGKRMTIEEVLQLELFKALKEVEEIRKQEQNPTQKEHDKNKVAENEEKEKDVSNNNKEVQEQIF